MDPGDDNNDDDDDQSEEGELKWLPIQAIKIKEKGKRRKWNRCHKTLFLQIAVVKSKIPGVLQSMFPLFLPI